VDHGVFDVIKLVCMTWLNAVWEIEPYTVGEITLH